MKYLKHLLNRYTNHLTSIWKFSAVRIMSVNLLVTSIIGWLYLENYILPASIGSRINGERLVNALESGAYMWAIFTGYLALHCAHVVFVPSKIKWTLNNHCNLLAMRCRDLSHVIVFRFFLTINIISSPPRRSLPNLSLALYPLTYFNHNLND